MNHWNGCIWVRCNLAVGGSAFYIIRGEVCYCSPCEWERYMRMSIDVHFTAIFKYRFYFVFLLSNSRSRQRICVLDLIKLETLRAMLDPEFDIESIVIEHLLFCHQNLKYPSIATLRAEILYITYLRIYHCDLYTNNKQYLNYAKEKLKSIFSEIAYALGKIVKSRYVDREEDATPPFTLDECYEKIIQLK